MPVVVEDISQDGIIYFLARARAMSVYDARNVLNWELHVNPKFDYIWELSRHIYNGKVCSNPFHDWNHMERECHLAIICYLLEVPNISRIVNRYCRQALPEPTSWDAFPYKGLWFFLLRAFEMLPPFNATQVFRGVHTLSITRHGSVPLVQFLSSSRIISEALRFRPRDGLLLEINCTNPRYLRDVSFYAACQDGSEVLIWPFLTIDVFKLCDDLCEVHWWRPTPPGCNPRRLYRFERASQP